jgi:hypothetical protein
MAKPEYERRTKGTFGDVRLPMTKKYIFPSTRKHMMFMGGAGCLLIALYCIADALLLHNTFISSGPLSANHANFESECAKCHQSFKGVKDSKCSTCHEKTNDKLGVYTFAAHYVYRSEDANKIQMSKDKHGSDEKPCASCHPDHLGRDAKVTQVLDARCSSCHYKSFNNDHPQFAFARTNGPDDSTLKMTHVKHTKELLKLLRTPNIERACLYCHNPQTDGKGFKPLDFDMHCGDCHLTTSSETPSLIIKDQMNPTSPGVETLEIIQRRRGPGTLWAFYTNPNEFSIKNGKVKKSPVYHRDPWILENLKLMYRTLYSDSSLADLLNASGRGAAKSSVQIYNEAITTLQDYVTGLRSRPELEVQIELMRIDSLLQETQQKVNSHGTMLPDVFGAMNMVAENTSLSQSQRNDLEEFALKLTKPCLECHYVEHAAILSVKASQRTFMRAEFDHRAHITQRRCLECHDIIPVEQALAGDTTVLARVPMIDKATTHNIPTIENCFECHTRETGSHTCVTCHLMHPNKENRGSLQLFVEKK